MRISRATKYFAVDSILQLLLVLITPISIALQPAAGLLLLLLLAAYQLLSAIIFGLYYRDKWRFYYLTTVIFFFVGGALTEAAGSVYPIFRKFCDVYYHGIHYQNLFMIPLLAIFSTGISLRAVLKSVR